MITATCAYQATFANWPSVKSVQVVFVWRHVACVCVCVGWLVFSMGTVVMRTHDRPHQATFSQWPSKHLFGCCCVLLQYVACSCVFCCYRCDGEGYSALTTPYSHTGNLYNLCRCDVYRGDMWLGCLCCWYFQWHCDGGGHSFHTKPCSLTGNLYHLFGVLRVLGRYVACWCLLLVLAVAAVMGRATAFTPSCTAHWRMVHLSRCLVHWASSCLLLMFMVAVVVRLAGAQHGALTLSTRMKR